MALVIPTSLRRTLDAQKSEAFVALKAGADGLKVFPAEALPPAVLKAWLAVLPPGTLLVPVGSITTDNMADYVAAGAAGFGIGSSLYKPGVSAIELKERAANFVRGYRAIEPRR